MQTVGQSRHPQIEYSPNCPPSHATITQTCKQNKYVSNSSTMLFQLRILITILPFEGVETGQESNDDVISEARPLVKRLSQRSRCSQHQEVDAVMHKQL